MQVGATKGDVEDKFERFSIKCLPSEEGRPLVPEGSAAWMSCQVVSHQKIEGYRVWVARVADQGDLGKAPLVWHKDAFFGIKGL
jgi:flavin reductase (DIM6/NTAB) family NADH-FMN oxidoreductase RutF